MVYVKVAIVFDEVHTNSVIFPFNRNHKFKKMFVCLFFVCVCFLFLFCLLFSVLFVCFLLHREDALVIEPLSNQGVVVTP